MNLNDINDEELTDAIDTMADISKFIEHNKQLVADESLVSKEEFVKALDQMTTLFGLLITAGSMAAETQHLINEIENPN